ncbi:hypothetical protein L3Y34_016762 [Caenorhabditis briggsae]|uniref:Uncharacterized protein n=1 Tax=Caenorhabditis briggsae TaxID=6238 RepID=A0AAE9DY63_CAEBR|nr:hypothetical protein L3Y34_016762 [Caenorhabditis briggsae]
MSNQHKMEIAVLFPSCVVAKVYLQLPLRDKRKKRDADDKATSSRYPSSCTHLSNFIRFLLFFLRKRLPIDATS